MWVRTVFRDTVRWRAIWGPFNSVPSSRSTSSSRSLSSSIWILVRDPYPRLHRRDRTHVGGEIRHIHPLCLIQQVERAVQVSLSLPYASHRHGPTRPVRREPGALAQLLTCQQVPCFRDREQVPTERSSRQKRGNDAALASRDTNPSPLTLESSSDCQWPRGIPRPSFRSGLRRQFGQGAKSEQAQERGSRDQERRTAAATEPRIVGD